MGLHPEGPGRSACKQGICRGDLHVPKRDCRRYKKNDEKRIAAAIQDESIVIAGPRALKRGYTRKKIRALYTYTGSRSKTIVFGLITTDGRMMFRQYDRFDMHAFARFLRAAVRKFGKICMMPNVYKKYDLIGDLGFISDCYIIL